MDRPTSRPRVEGTTPRAQVQPPTKSVRGWTRWVALCAICAITLAATGIAFVESYDGLQAWAAHHLLSGTWAWIWPVQVDAFILIGELTLYLAVYERWPRRRHVLGWAVTLLGGVVSVLGNIGHVGGGHSGQVYGTAAVPPVAATAGLAIGLQVLKWILNLTRPKIEVRFNLVVRPEAEAFRLSPLHWTLAKTSLGTHQDRRSRSAEPATGQEPTSPPPVLFPVRAASTPERVRPASRTTVRVSERVRPATDSGRAQLDYQQRYDRGMKLYLDSVEAGEPLSQVKLARELGQTNRKLAARIIRDATENDLGGEASQNGA